MDYDDAYANAPYIPGAEAYPARWAQAARRWAARQDSLDRRRAGLAYGQGARQRFDLFLPDDTPEGLMIFVHGGYWLKFDRSDWLHLAEGAVARGWAAALPSYDRCPAVRIREITKMIASAVTAAADQSDGPIALAGHSAGGHLVARMLARGMLSPGVTARLKTVMPISPISDLKPLMQTSMNADLRIDPDEAEAESPVQMADRVDVPVTVWVGADERPVFLDQARWLAEAWGCHHVVEADRHHFNVIDSLVDPDSQMMDLLLG